MAHAWNGADPTQAADPGSYELSVEYVANSPITISAVRVWAGVSPGDFASRRGRVWTTDGSLLGSAAMPTTLPSGWSEYALDTPVDITTGGHFVVSYSSGGNYGESNHALDTGVVSADGLVTAVAGPAGAHGNGAFTTTPTTLPDHASGQNTFYGIDLVYTATGGNTPPSITAMTVTAVGTLATAVITATDQETLAGATYTVDWGDGTSPVSGSGDTQHHTYAADGVYAVLGLVTDAGGLSDSAARPIVVSTPQDQPTGIGLTRLTGLLGDHAATTGYFPAGSILHEPTSAPGDDLCCAVWLLAGEPARGASGLAATTLALTFAVRLYAALPQIANDALDPAMVDALDALLSGYSGDFTLGGAIRNIDLLGEFGTPLSWESGYQKLGARDYRVMTITVPVVINDVWEQREAA